MHPVRRPREGRELQTISLSCGPITGNPRQRQQRVEAKHGSQEMTLAESVEDFRGRKKAFEKLPDRHGDVMRALSVTMPIGYESSEDAVERVRSVLSEPAQAMRNMI
jgi:IclR family transcriptional regulator, pca regulon regulatory protein